MKNKILLIIIIGFFTSCLGTKKIVENKKEVSVKNKTETLRDSINVVERNKPIKDQITTVIPKTNTSDEEFNKRVDKEVDRILSKLNTKKSSGSNSYVSRYDKETRQLIVDFIVAQTESKLTQTNTNNNKETEYLEKVDTYIKKVHKIIPWWFYLIVAFLYRRTILNFISFFFPHIKTVQSFSDLYNKKK